MNIKKYLKKIGNKINKINEYITNPINYEDINNPFQTNLNKTYVWVDEKENKKKKY